ncbi:MAG: Rid family detoxifying hydrolase [Firmicutes bacterium]|nr:Rid family detoxifying hydrolase [Bacillota bacterium]
MTVQRIMAARAPQALALYSHIVRAGDFVFVTGQMPIDPLTNEYVRGDIIKQAQRVLENLRIVLGTLDCDFHDVVSARVFLTDMRNFETVNRVYAAYFDEDLPARTCVAVTELAGKADIEIDLVVYKPHLSSS